MAQTVIAALYKFATLDDYSSKKEPLLQVCLDNGIKGTLLLASEGVNGTVAGSRQGIDNLLAFIKSDPRLSDLVHKESYDDANPFLRMKVRLKKEIVTMGVEGTDPNKIVGSYVKPKEWNDLISDPDVVVIDTRNDYEVEIGTFKGAIDPHTKSFREFPDWARNANVFKNKPKIAMFCTGGIRCEKSTAFMKELGYDDVYHLEGGILKYLEEVPEEESLWQGECYVFDERVSVKHGLEPGQYSLCHGCREPITDEDKQNPVYEEGICCPRCHDRITPEQRTRFAERHKQMQLAKGRGKSHMGETQNQTHTRRPVLSLDDFEKSRPVLYSFRRCPYAMRARLALQSAGIECDYREVVLRDKPDHMLEISPKGTVPVLQTIDGGVLEESLDIMMWALEQNDPDNLLYPCSGSLEDMLQLIKECDGEFKTHLDRYKYADRYDDADALEERRHAESFIQILESRLSEKDFLFGSEVTLADFAIAPFIRQFANTDRDWFDQANYPRVQNWLQVFIESAAFRAIMPKQKQWYPGDALTLFPFEQPVRNAGCPRD